MPQAIPSQRILVITLSNIGDLVMTTPVLEALAAKYPGALLDIVCDARSSALLRPLPYLGTLFHRDKRAPKHSQWRLLRQLRQTRYALVVDLRTKFIPYLLRTERRLFKPARADLQQHAVLEHFATLKPVLGDIPPPACRLYLDTTAQDVAQDLLKNLPGQRWLVIAPGANWPGKRWPAQAYSDLLEHCSESFDAAIVVAGNGDLERPFHPPAGGLPVLDLSDRTDLATAAAVIARASAFVGNDSGLGHIAAALAVPTLTVFGPGDVNRYRPSGKHVRVASAPQQNLAALSVATVAQELHQLMDSVSR
jgi:heptosyltransferase-3